jgi:hypothetical protein
MLYEGQMVAPNAARRCEIEKASFRTFSSVSSANEISAEW